MPTLIVARRRRKRKLITSDIDERDRIFLTGERTPEGFFRLKEGTASTIALPAASPLRARRCPVVGNQPPDSTRRAPSPMRSRALSGQVAGV